jgi:hypothetical protein
MSVINWIRRQIGTEPDPCKIERQVLMDRVSREHSQVAADLIRSARSASSSIRIERDWTPPQDDPRLR